MADWHVINLSFLYRISAANILAAFKFAVSLGLGELLRTNSVDAHEYVGTEGAKDCATTRSLRIGKV